MGRCRQTQTGGFLRRRFYKETKSVRRYLPHENQEMIAAVILLALNEADRG